ncbi:MAG: cytochrome ubiquinol oxidase subunit I [Chloroflexi bacterium]|nr:cytochrome ubiquinol oxidase subunit I [Chloroflexota bacterium]
MSPLLAARMQMAFSLGFHMLFAAAGMALPLMMVIAEGRWLRTGDPEALRLANTWGKATAVLFALGAVSGTALSFELGLLWPRFMTFAGPLIGPAFALEGYAFFIEAIFLGLYLYGWNRLSSLVHWLCGVAVVVSGVSSGIIVLATVSWMHSPVGFRLEPDGSLVNIDPLAAIFNPAFGLMAAHSTVSTYQAIGFAIAGVYAWALLRNRRPARVHYNRMAIVVAMLLAAPAALAQPVLGDLLATRLYHEQPTKLAAMESQFFTERGAPLRIGGWPDPEARETYWAIEIPKGLSYLATRDADAVVRGLEEFPRDEWPPVQIVHPAFQLMVVSGVLMLGIAAWFWWAWWREGRRGRDWWSHRWLLVALALATPLGFLALESGWVVTEVGRQPWIIYRILRTQEAVTPIVEVFVSLMGFVLLYSGLIATLALLLRRMARGEGETEELGQEQHNARD